jgi:hypothetical protein
MMTLFDVALAGNTEQFRDTYGTATFYGQVMLFNESVRSGPAARRRIIEVGPDVVVPSKMTVTEVSTNQVFVLAEGSTDWYKGVPIAVKHPAIPIDTTYSLRTVEQVLAGTVVSELMYAMPSYIRRVIIEDTSDYLGGYEMVYSPYYMPVTVGKIFYGSDGRWFRCRENSRKDDLGLGVSEVVELNSPLQTLAYKALTYNPVTDTFSEAVSVNVQAFIVPLYLNYTHEVLGSPKIEDGDVALTVLKSAITTLKTNEKVGSYLVISVESSGNTWVAHARRNH